MADDLLARAITTLGYSPKDIHAEIEARGVRGTVLKYVFAFDRPYENALVAGAILMWDQYKRSPLTIRGYLDVFRSWLRDDVVRFMETHEEALQSMVERNMHRDFAMTYFSASTLIDTYLSRTRYDSPPVEIPQLLYLRVAIGEFCHEGLDQVAKIYERFSSKQGIPSSPTLFNMGYKEGAPSSCMILEPDDSLDDILMTCAYEAGMASKNNAGLGVFLGNLRHSNIGRHGISQGIIPLVKMLDDQVWYINQGGRRPGSMTVSTNIHHYDTPEFIRIVDKVGEERTRVSKVNTSLMLNDVFMQRCRDGGMYTFFCPKQTPGLNALHGKAFEAKYLEYEDKAMRGEIACKRIDANAILDEICDMQIKTGMPYIIHACNANRKNNMCNVGPVRVNLCQEIFIPTKPLEQTACCNLMSIALNAFVRNGAFDFVAFGECVRDFVACLNRVIDHSYNVSDKVRRSNTLNRPIGIGVNGFSDMCMLLDLAPVDINRLPKHTTDDEYVYVDIVHEAPDYDEDALKTRTLNPAVQELNWKIWSCMYYNALLGSLEEAKKYGPYPNFYTSPTAQGKLQYHLWQEEEREMGRTYPFRLDPVNPADWGQEGSWDALIQDIKKYGLRNALLLTCMPTASTANVLGNCESTEYHMQNIYMRKVQSGDYPVLNYHMVRDLAEIGLWTKATYDNIVANDGSLLHLPETGLDPDRVVRLRYLKEKYLTMWELPQKIVIDLAAQRQVFIDHSQSMNLYIAHPTKEVLKAVHMYTWEMGLKTGMYYLRTKAVGEALKIGTRKCTGDVCISCQ